MSGDGRGVAYVAGAANALDNPDQSGAEIRYLECPIAKLEIVKTYQVIDPAVDPLKPDVGDQVVYNVTIVNGAVSDFVGGVVVTDTLPPGVTYESSAMTEQPASSVVTLSMGSPRTPSWTIQNLAAGTRVVVAITGRVDRGTAGQSITNTVALTVSN